MIPTNKKKIFIYTGALVLVILLILSGNEYRKYKNTFIKREQERLSKLYSQSKHREDSLNLIIENGKLQADEFRNLWIEAEARNSKSFKELKKRINENSTRIDTSFINNAFIISNTVSRYFKDTIK